MPQYPQTNLRNQAGQSAFGSLDGDGASQLVANGLSSALNVTNARVLKVGPGRLVRIVVLGAVGSAGALTLNDSATVAGAATANVVYTIPGTVAVGTVITVDAPTVNGLVVSAVPTGGTPQFAISYS
jgi:hypothetical protein